MYLLIAYLCKLSAELQSKASKQRRKSQNFKNGKKPDSMVIVTIDGYEFEIMFNECSRLVAEKSKMHDDYVKCWRECSDGMSYAHRSCNPTRNQFVILSVQVFGTVNFILLIM